MGRVKNWCWPMVMSEGECGVWGWLMCLCAQQEGGVGCSTDKWRQRCEGVKVLSSYQSIWLESESWRGGGGVGGSWRSQSRICAGEDTDTNLLTPVIMIIRPWRSLLLAPMERALQSKKSHPPFEINDPCSSKITAAMKPKSTISP